MGSKWQTKDFKELLKEKLMEIEWRRNSWYLYKIRDKDWNVVPFLPNKYQLWLNREAHSFNVILKARQIWFTTDIDVAILLDKVLFTRNVKAWIIAHNMDAVKEIFEEKIKFVYDNLPEWLKWAVEADSDNAKELRFSNWSSIRVATSFRSWTLQFLHISELWKIAIASPKRAEEIITWALPAVWQGWQIFVESTAEWKTWEFYALVTRAMKLQKQGKELNAKEPKFFFVAWWENEWYAIDDPYLELSKETLNYFKELKTSQWIEVSTNQMKWYQTEKAIQRSNMMREYPSYPEEAFKVAVKWAYFAKQVEQAYKEKRECRLPYEPTLQTFVTMDIWVSDAMSILVYQRYWTEVRILRWWNVTNFWVKQVHQQLLRPLLDEWWTIDCVFLPHDWAVRSANDTQTREDTFNKLWYRTEVMSALRVMDSIELARDKFPYCYFDSVHTTAKIKEDVEITLLEILNEYKEKIDNMSWLWLWRPDHNEASHPWDAFRYLCQSLAYVVDVMDDDPWEVLWPDDEDDLY